MKQTAIEELIRKIELMEIADHVINPLGIIKGIAKELLEKEKELQAKHEEQLKEAVINAITSKGIKALEAVYGRKLTANEHLKVLEEAEAYYNETYKKD